MPDTIAAMRSRQQPHLSESQLRSWADLVGSPQTIGQQSGQLGIIFFNGTRILRPAVADLMDHAPETALLTAVEDAARSVEGVKAVEKSECVRA
jgi:hypothetical protein